MTHSCTKDFDPCRKTCVFLLQQTSPGPNLLLPGWDTSWFVPRCWLMDSETCGNIIGSQVKGLMGYLGRSCVASVCMSSCRVLHNIRLLFFWVKNILHSVFWLLKLDKCDTRNLTLSYSCVGSFIYSFIHACMYSFYYSFNLHSFCVYCMSWIILIARDEPINLTNTKWLALRSLHSVIFFLQSQVHGFKNNHCQICSLKWNDLPNM